ncbi:MAG: hypothetical protein WAS21_17265 [Geminicoccaceae bacterium]
MALELELAAFRAEFARAAPAGRPVLCEAKIEELRAYQAALPQIAALGGHSIASPPRLPDGSLTMAEIDDLIFDVLSDVRDLVARRFGPVHALPEEWWAALWSNGKALPGINGDGSWELPVPATYVIGQDARAASAFINVGHRNRFEPERIASALQLLRSA